VVYKYRIDVGLILDARDEGLRKEVATSKNTHRYGGRKLEDSLRYIVSRELVAACC
jgi:hypothetical protein